jgi:methyltransferase-like protein
LVDNFPPAVQEVLIGISDDPVQREQYMDFVRNRTFRQTLLCRNTVVTTDKLHIRNLTNLYVGSPLRPVAKELDIHSPNEEQFRTPDGRTISTRDPLHKAAMTYLAAIWPQNVAFPKLLQASRACLPELTGQEAEVGESLARWLLVNYCKSLEDVVELRVQPGRFVVEPSQRPLASPLARLQAGSGSRITNRCHEMVYLSDFQRQVLERLDGSLDHTGLVHFFVEQVSRGKLNLSKDGQAVTEPERIPVVLKDGLEKVLFELARMALLIA